MTLEQLENEINALKSQMNVEQNKLNELEYELYLLKQQRTLQAPPVPSPPPMPYKTPMSSKASHKPSFTPPPPQVNSKSFDIEKFIGKVIIKALRVIFNPPFLYHQNYQRRHRQ